MTKTTLKIEKAEEYKKLAELIKLNQRKIKMSEFQAIQNEEDFLERDLAALLREFNDREWDVKIKRAKNVLEILKNGK